MRNRHICEFLIYYQTYSEGAFTPLCATFNLFLKNLRLEYTHIEYLIFFPLHFVEPYISSYTHGACKTIIVSEACPIQL